MNSVSVLRTIGIIEGLSWLVLLFIAMPMKYAMGIPMATRIVGSIHGFLFVIFCVALLWATFDRSWRVTKSGLFFGGALLPFGFLFIDKHLKAEIPQGPAAG